MLVKRPLLAVLMLGVSTVVLHSEALTGQGEAPAAPAALFGAPPPPPAGAFPVATPERPAARPAETGPFVLDPPKPAPVDAAAAGGEPTVDLGALRYYASQNDLARVAAEIRLLRAKHPGWSPPEDLFTEVRGGESEQPLWDLLAKRDFDGLEAAMAERRARTPDWQPSADLAGKLALARGYAALVKASDAGDWAGAVEVAAAHGDLLTCANVDALWRTAEALARTGDEGRAAEAYRYVLAHCAKPAERLATVQKASLLLHAPEAVDGLLQMGRRLPNGAGEFDQVRLDGIRRKVGDLAAGKAGPAPTPAEIDELTAQARKAGGHTDPELLGWLAYSRKDFAGAETWFGQSLAAGPSAKGAEGLVLALREGGKKAEAARSALQYAGLDPANRKLMVEVLSGSLGDPAAPPLSAEQTAALAAGIDEAKSADAAQALGWVRYKAGDVAGADSWFRKSVAWQPNEAAVIGQVVVAGRLKHAAEVKALIAQYRATYPKLEALAATMTVAARPVRVARHVARGGRVRGPAGEGWDAGASAIVHTFENGQVDQAMAMLDARKATRGKEPKGLTVVRGWALYKKGDWDGAEKVFTDLGTKGMTNEASEGLRVIKLGYTNPRYR